MKFLLALFILIFAQIANAAVDGDQGLAAINKSDLTAQLHDYFYASDTNSEASGKKADSLEKQKALARIEDSFIDSQHPEKYIYSVRKLSTSHLENTQLIASCEAHKCADFRIAVVLSTDNKVLAVGTLEKSCVTGTDQKCHRKDVLAKLYRPASDKVNMIKYSLAEQEVVQWLWSNEYASPPMTINEMTFVDLAR